MNEIVTRFLLAGDRFMPKMHLKQPRFTYLHLWIFYKKQGRIQKFKQTGDS